MELITVIMEKTNLIWKTTRNTPQSLLDFAPQSLAYLLYQWLVQSSKQLSPLVIFPIIV